MSCQLSYQRLETADRNAKSAFATLAAILIAGDRVTTNSTLFPLPFNLFAIVQMGKNAN